MKIALDAMGGDFAPARPVAAAVNALERFPGITELYLVGHQDRINEELARVGVKSDDRLKVYHCTQVIEMDEGAVDSVRRKRDSSINRSIELVKEGKADAVISAGHTGAMVASSSIKLRTLPGIGRAGIAAIMPTEFNRFVLMDAGANIDAEPDNLVEYGIMGSIFSSHVLGFEDPKVGLMSVGTEESKGNEVTKKAYKLLSDAPVNFVGNVEGHDLYERPVEVVVCEGFVGNVILKTSESLANAIFAWLKREIKSNPLRRIGAVLAKGAFASIKKRTSYEEIGGCLLLGVNGIVVISHGSSTVKAIANAIGAGVNAVDTNLNDDILAAMDKWNQTLEEKKS
ncbi:MAG: phosphate acyltransferase PlsX [Verrucomicrobiota bacterium]